VLDMTRVDVPALRRMPDPPPQPPAQRLLTGPASLPASAPERVGVSHDVYEGITVGLEHAAGALRDPRGVGAAGENYIQELTGGSPRRADRLVTFTRAFPAASPGVTSWFNPAEWQDFLRNYVTSELRRPSGNAREVDSLVLRGPRLFANEAKSGAPFLTESTGQRVRNCVDLDARVRQQVNNDAALRDFCRLWRREPPYFEPVWHFVGTRGSPELLAELRARGIPYVDHTPQYDLQTPGLTPMR